MNHEPSLHWNQKSGDHDPSEQSELVLEVPLFQTEDESQKANNHQHEADEAMMGQKRSNERVPLPQDRRLAGDEVSKRVIIDSYKYVPVDIFG